MRVTVNGQEKDIQGEDITVQDVLDTMSFNTLFFVIFLNNEFIDRLQYLKREVKEGDELTIFPLVTGA
ncbi:MAG: sulfur carrier protein ThiS [Bacteroidota bacterium]